MTILSAGTPAPDFTLHSTPDQTVSLLEFRGRNVILAFYPADWSPVCADQLGLYNELLEEFGKHDANFHWHMSGPHFRDDHLLLDEQGDQLFAMTDPIAERVRKLGGGTLRSIGHIARLQRIDGNGADYVEPEDMLAELHEDNVALITRLRETRNVCDERRDVATASVIEEWIDKGERRAWFLFEASRRPDSTGR